MAIFNSSYGSQLLFRYTYFSLFPLSSLLSPSSALSSLLSALYALLFRSLSIPPSLRFSFPPFLPSRLPVEMSF